MFFLLSRLLWIFFSPSGFLVLMTVAVAVLLHTRYAVFGQRLAVVAAALLFLIGFFPVYVWLLRPLENRYVRPAWPARVDGVIVLGAGSEPDVLATRGAVRPEQSDARFIAAFELARRYPDARILFTGGSGNVGGPAFAEARDTQYLFRQMGLKPERLLLEGNSRNTWENILLSMRMVKPQPNQTWLLATSAYQMPRAMLAAKRLHWKLIPWPTDYMTPRSGMPPFFDVPENLRSFDLTVHEWIGLLVYDLK